MLQRKRDESDEAALAGYTFHPKTTKCPTYITRIARGMALAHARRPASPVLFFLSLPAATLRSQAGRRDAAKADAKPDWR